MFGEIERKRRRKTVMGGEESSVGRLEKGGRVGVEKRKIVRRRHDERKRSVFVKRGRKIIRIVT